MFNSKMDPTLFLFRRGAQHWESSRKPETRTKLVMFFCRSNITKKLSDISLTSQLEEGVDHKKILFIDNLFNFGTFKDQRLTINFNIHLTSKEKFEVIR